MSAPVCAGCGHMVLFHGAGHCTPPFASCDCPATVEVVWPESPAPKSNDSANGVS